MPEIFLLIFFSFGFHFENKGERSGKRNGFFLVQRRCDDDDSVLLLLLYRFCLLNTRNDYDALFPMVTLHSIHPVSQLS